MISKKQNTGSLEASEGDSVSTAARSHLAGGGKAAAKVDGSGLPTVPNYVYEDWTETQVTRISNFDSFSFHPAESFYK